jgi:ribose transport system ATP-binding protein
MSDHPAPPALSLVNMTKGFPGVQALSGVNFEVYGGQVVALLGAQDHLRHFPR